MKNIVLPALVCSALFISATVPYSVGQGAAGQSKVGVIQGIVVRAGTAEPVPDVQITLTGTGGRVNPTINGPTGQLITLTPEMAQQLIDAVASGNPNVIGMPREFVDVAREVLDAAQNPATETGGPANPLTTVTDSNGAFKFSGVPAGRVTVRAQAQGFFAPPVNGYYAPNATVAAVIVADKPADVRLELIPGGTISGRVVDPAGKPLAEVSIQALQRSYTNGTATLTETNVKQTDDRGEYRLYRLPPGEYFLAVIPRRAPSQPPGTTEIPVATFYPGTSEAAAASPIVLRGGDELSGHNIQLKTTPTSTVSGKVISALEPGPVTNRDGQVRTSIASVFIARRDALGLSLPELGTFDTVTVNPDDGSFILRNVPTGAYEVFARLPSASNSDWGTSNPPVRATAPWAFGRTAIDVRGGADLKGVVVTVHHGSDLKGQIFVDGRPAAADIRLAVLPDDSAANVNDGPTSGVFGQITQFAPTIGQEGSFIVPVLPDGRYRFLIGIGSAPTAGGNRGGASPPPLPASAYVADIRQRGMSVYDNGLVVTAQGVDPVEVLIATNGSKIAGTVTGPDQKPLSKVTVVLVPQENRRQNPALYKSARSDAQGHFEINPIAPGSYTMFAWENPPAGAWLNPDYLSRYLRRGTPVNVTSGIQNSVTIEPLRD